MSKGVGEMVRSRSVQVKASAGTEGARRATGVPADGAAGEAGPLAPAQRWERGPEAGRGAAVAARRSAGGAVAGSGRRDLPAGGLAGPGRGRCCARLAGPPGRPRGGGARRGEAAHRGAVEGERAAA